MDPLSVIASTIAIVTPITVGLQGLRHARQAKKDLLQLANEVADIAILLQELGQLLRQQSQYVTTGPHPILMQALEASKTKLQELSDQISTWNGQSSAPKSPTKVATLKWMKITSRVKAFKDDLQRIRSQLMTVLSSLNL
jgi:hypothetical protein